MLLCVVVATPHDPDRPTEWTPATSRPGELYTVEGEIRSVGAFARGLKHRDPRGRAYRRSMLRTGLLFLTAAALVLVAAVVLAVAF